MVFAIYSHESATGVHVSPIPNPLLPPSHPIPLGCPSSPALSALFHAWNLDWSSISHMVIYMFQCCSLRSSHPHLLPQSPKACSLYVSLLLSRIYGRHYHLSKFHVCRLGYCIGVFLSDFTRIKGSSSIHLVRTDSNAFLIAE